MEKWAAAFLMSKKLTYDISIAAAHSCMPNPAF